MQTFNEWKNENSNKENFFDANINPFKVITEGKEELSEEEEEIGEEVVQKIKEELEKGKSIDDIINEGALGKLFGGLTGFAAGKKLGKILADVLGLEKDGILYDLFTSRLFGASIGSAIGDRL